MGALYLMAGALMAGGSVAAIMLDHPAPLPFVLIGIGLGCAAVFNDSRRR